VHKCQFASGTQVIYGSCGPDVVLWLAVDGEVRLPWLRFARMEPKDAKVRLNAVKPHEITGPQTSASANAESEHNGWTNVACMQ